MLFMSILKCEWEEIACLIFEVKKIIAMRISDNIIGRNIFSLYGRSSVIMIMLISFK